MPTSKHIPTGTGDLHTTDQLSWSDPKDLEHYANHIAADDNAQDRHKHLIEQIMTQLWHYEQTMDRAIQYLRQQPFDAPEIGLEALPIGGKISLLRALLLERSNELPHSTRMKYLARFEDDLQKYEEADRHLKHAVSRYLLYPGGTWLRELTDTWDWLGCAWFDLDESMRCEHNDYVGTIPHGSLEDYAAG